MDKFKKAISKFLNETLTKNKIKTDLKSVEELIEIPPDKGFGDYAFPCFMLSKELKKSPNDIAKNLTLGFKPNKYLKEVEAVGPYLNFKINKTLLTKQVLLEVKEKKDKFGHKNLGKSKKIVIDMSSPNIAKPFSIGHLRSTNIGNSISRIYSALGYKCIKINHLGDWGTQFGKLICAYVRWGNEEKLKEEPVKYLLELYVRFHKEAEKNPDLEDEGRAWFKKLEEKDEKAVKLWKLFREYSIEEFKRIYKMLNVDFDYYHGESFYEPMLDETFDLLNRKGLTERSQGALVINLKGMPPCIIKKSDNTSTYALRDLAALVYRTKNYNPSKILYVVGSEQKLHFEQVFKIYEMAGFDKKIPVHVPFGLIMLPEGRMSTREGKVIFLEEVLKKSIELALETINKKNPDLKDKEKVAKIVGIGSVVFADLVNDRVKDIEFKWDKVLDFEGETAPYIQYTHARISSILRKHGKINFDIDYSLLKGDSEINLVKQLYLFNKKIREAAESYKPHIIARYVLELCQQFNEFYHKCPILNAEKKIMEARIVLINAVRQVIENSTYLLGIKCPGEM